MMHLGVFMLFAYCLIAGDQESQEYIAPTMSRPSFESKKAAEKSLSKLLKISTLEEGETDIIDNLVSWVLQDHNYWETYPHFDSKDLLSIKKNKDYKRLAQFSLKAIGAIGGFDERYLKLLMASVLGDITLFQEALLTLEDINKKTICGRTLPLIAISSGNKHILEYFIKNGLNPNQENDRKITLLHQACIDNNKEIVQFLLENGAKPNTMDSEKVEAPLHVAIHNNDKEIFDLLLKYKADPNYMTIDTRTPLDMASYCGHLHLMKLLIKKGAIFDDTAKARAICYACEDGYSDILKFLLDEEADPNQTNVIGETILKIASGRGHEKIVRILLQNGANPNKESRNGDTALRVASCWHYKKIIFLLLEAGAIDKPSLSYGGTALSVALGAEKWSIVQMLRFYQLKRNNAELFKKVKLEGFLMKIAPKLKKYKGDFDALIVAAVHDISVEIAKKSLGDFSLFEKCLPREFIESVIRGGVLLEDINEKSWTTFNTAYDLMLELGLLKRTNITHQEEASFSKS